MRAHLVRGPETKSQYYSHKPRGYYLYAVRFLAKLGGDELRAQVLAAAGYPHAGSEWTSAANVLPSYYFYRISPAIMRQVRLIY